MDETLHIWLDSGFSDFHVLWMDHFEKRQSFFNMQVFFWNLMFRRDFSRQYSQRFGIDHWKAMELGFSCCSSTLWNVNQNSVNLKSQTPENVFGCEKNMFFWHWDPKCRIFATQEFTKSFWKFPSNQRPCQTVLGWNIVFFQKIVLKKKSHSPEIILHQKKPWLEKEKHLRNTNLSVSGVILDLFMKVIFYGFYQK